MCMRENRNRGPKMKLCSQIFVSQPLCCAIAVPYMLPPFLIFLHPQPFYPGMGHLYLLIVPPFLCLLDSCLGVSCSSAVQALQGGKEKWLQSESQTLSEQMLGSLGCTSAVSSAGGTKEAQAGFELGSLPFSDPGGLS